MALRSGESLWLETNDEPERFPSLHHDARCDVAIIGGGISGALLAQRLIDEGRDAMLLDKGQIGSGSTAASTSLLQHELDVELVRLIPQVGEAAAVRAYQLGLDAIRQIQDLTSRLGDDCGFIPRDSLYLASREGDVELLVQESECRRRYGFDAAFISRAEVERRFPFTAPAGLLSTGDAEIDALQLTRLLVDDSAERGLRVHNRTPVTGLEPEKHHWRLRAENGSIVTADRVVFATGYESAKYLGQPIGRLNCTFAVASEPMESFPEWPGRCLIWETARPYFYLRSTADNRILIGGEDTLDPDDWRREGVLERKTATLVARFHRLFPDAALKVAHAWGGTFGESHDGLPYIGQAPGTPNVYFILGYGGNGITMSAIGAELIADLCAGRENRDSQIFRLDR